MGKVKEFEKPVGFHDLLPTLSAKKRLIENKLQELFQMWGYREIHTPTLEFDETVGKASKIPNEKMFKLLDRTGKTLVLRPDMTAPIARVVSSILKEDGRPIRLSYHSNVFRAQENEAGRASEFFQSGVEFIGEGTPSADAEILALATESLKLLNIGDFRITVGHTGYLNGILNEWIDNEEIKETLKKYLAEKNMVGYRDKVKEVVSSEKGIQALLSVFKINGDFLSLSRALAFTESDEVKKAINDLMQVGKLLQIYGVDSYVSYDLSLVPHLEYYTGMVFEGTAKKTSFPVCSGGRYDTLFKAFNNPQQAIGFALKINRILEISQSQEDDTTHIIVLYDNKHQEEALTYILKMRSTTNRVVESYRIEEDNLPAFVEDKRKTNETIVLFLT